MKMVYRIAQYYIGVSYEYGRGIRKGEVKAFEWVQGRIEKSAENKNMHNIIRRIL